jgi:uncharacterized protein YndB with AHSA1/START domain/iron-sulfur cluster repair protein YtfE (RIC family)
VSHRAIRQDLRRVAARLGGVDVDKPPERTDALFRYTAALLGQIRAHHDGEDEILWPVVAAIAGQAVDLAPLADDRQAVNAAAGKASQALARAGAGPGAAAELRASVGMLRDVLTEHLDDEEAQVLPTIRRYLTVETYRWCEKEAWRRSALCDRMFTMPWLARHARPDERGRLLAAFGWQERALRAAAGPGYARLERQALGGETRERTSAMGQLQVAAEQIAQAAPDAVWELICDASRYPQWGPWSAGGYQRYGDASPHGAGAVRWLRSASRYGLRHMTSVEKILEVHEGRRLAYTVIGGIPVRNYRAEITLTPAGTGTLIRWVATWDTTMAGCLVWRGLRTFYPRMIDDLVTAAEERAGSGMSP